MRPVPADLEELENASTAQAMASALEWIEDIEVVRKNSSYQGVLSRRIKERTAALGKLMRVFASRVEEKGDIGYLRRRNAELQAQLAASERESKKMNRRMDELQKTIEELRKLIVEGGKTSRDDKATSPMEDCSAAQRRSSSKQKSLTMGSMADAVMRPPIKGVSVPIPERRNEDEILTCQIQEL